jgi:hypothetical protein
LFANIARLPLFEQQTAGFLAFLFTTLQTRSDFLSKEQTVFSQIVFFQSIDAETMHKGPF